MDDPDVTIFTLPISLLANIDPVVPKSKVVEANTQRSEVAQTTQSEAATQEVAMDTTTTPESTDQAVETSSGEQSTEIADDNTIIVTGTDTENVSSHNVDMDGDSIIITSSVTDTHASTYTAKQLRDKLKANQLSTAGGKAAMIQRLLDHDVTL